MHCHSRLILVRGNQTTNMNLAYLSTGHVLIVIFSDFVLEFHSDTRYAEFIIFQLLLKLFTM